MVGDILVIIERCNAGDSEAWKLFVKDFAPLSKNILLNYFDFKPAEQEDVIQNVFVRLINGGLEHFRGGSIYEFLKYFKIIVINEAKSQISAENRVKETIKLDGDISRADAEALRDGTTFLDSAQDPGKASRPDLIVEDRDLLEKIAAIIRTYPLIDQEIFMLKVKGYKDEDIRNMLKVPAGTVASKYSRIRTKIVEELGENL